jgi:hypothetical protein
MLGTVSPSRPKAGDGWGQGDEVNTYQWGLMVEEDGRKRALVPGPPPPLRVCTAMIDFFVR